MTNDDVMPKASGLSPIAEHAQGAASKRRNTMVRDIISDLPTAAQVLPARTAPLLRPAAEVCASVLQAASGVSPLLLIRLEVTRLIASAVGFLRFRGPH